MLRNMASEMRTGVDARCTDNATANSIRSGWAVRISIASLTGVLMPPFGTAADLPTGGRVTGGNATISESGNSMTVRQSSSNVTIDWATFDIGAGDSVTFRQPNSSAIAVNDIVGQSASSIFGALSANGQVFLVNPNGVLFGRTAQVDVGGLVASSLSLNNNGLGSGKYSFGATTAPGGISNLGSISASPGGYVAFIGPQVSNAGTLSAPLGTVALGAGSQVTLTLSGHSVVGFNVDVGALNALAANTQLIRADGGQVLLTSRGIDSVISGVVNNSGTIEATTVSNQSGVIRLLASGGTAEVGGTLDASATQGGNGGSIETSGERVQVADGTRVTTRASDGKSGGWLIDPADFTVAPSGGDMTGATLSSNLNSTNTTIQSSNGASSVTGGGGGGNININDGVAWSANTTLTLTASNNVNVNANIAATGNTAGLVVNPSTTNGGQPASGSGTFNLQLGNSITLSGATPSLSIGGNPYTVINALGAASSTSGTDLQGISGNLSGYYALGSNIDASATSGWNGGAGFTPLGTQNANFTGVLNGLGHSISNLTIDQFSGNFLGLFGETGGTAVIQNVGVAGGSVTGSQIVGGLVGFNNGAIANSYSTARVTGDYFGSNIGGLAGINYGAIINSYATGAVSGHTSVGGLVGDNEATISYSYATGSVTSSQADAGFGGLAGGNGGAITNSYATGSVSAGGGAGVGGLVGINEEESTASISNSYATGAVNGGTAGSNEIGGLVGGNFGAITTSYATGSVNGVTSVGGLVGNNGGSISNSYWNSDVNTTGIGAGTSGGASGLTASQMQTASNFVGFNFTAVPGASGNNWVLIDGNGTLNNASGAGGAVLPMLASEYSTTINNAHQLQLMAMNFGASYVLAQNVDASGTGNGSDVWGSAGFIPVGYSYLNTFSGALNGQGLTISGLTINLPAANFVGLFGYIGSGSVVENVVLTGGSVSGAQYVGGLVGVNLGGSVINSSAAGTVTGTGYVGGLAGTNENGGYIGQSHATGNVSGANGSDPYTVDIGGLVGLNSGSVVNSYATGAVTASAGYDGVGGLVGTNVGVTVGSYATGSVSAGGATAVGGLTGYNDGYVVNSYASGAVSGSSSVGGLVGEIEGGTVTDSYATGGVSGSGKVGGLVGYLNPGYVGGSVNGSYWDLTTSGEAGSSGGTGLTDSQMKSGASFSGWSLANTGGSGDSWRIYEGNTYPLLTSFLKPLTLGDAPDVTTTYNGASQSGATTAVNGVLGSAAAGTNAGFYNGYYSTQQGYDISGGNLTIAPASLTLSGTRLYDGTTTVAGSVLTASGVAGQTFTVTGSGDPSNLGSKNVQTGTTLASTTGLALGTSSNGGLASNYLPLSDAASFITITPVALTGASIASANSTYGSTVTPGMVSFSNLIPGDTVSATASIVNPVYSSSGHLNAGGYYQTASSLTGTDAEDYTFAGYTTPTANYTVGQLVLSSAAIAAANSIYGSSVTPGAVTFNNLIAGDAVGSTASILNPVYSTSGHLDAGSYYQKASGLTGKDAGDYSFAGFTSAAPSYGVGQLALVVTGNFSSTNRAYNGGTADTLRGTGSVTPIKGDVAHLSGTATGTFANANVGTAKPVSVSGYTLSGADANNYVLVEPTNLTANITQLASVAWVGGSSGNWSVASNWAGGAIPDYGNVAAVTIPAGDTVTYDAAVPGATTLTKLTSSGNVEMAAGSLSTSGGFSTAGYSQSGGALTVGGSLSINSASGVVTLGAIQAGSLNVTSQSGAIQQLSATTLSVTGASSLNAPGAAVVLANATNAFGGTIAVAGSNVDLLQGSGALKLGNVNATGALTVADLSGAITQAAGTVINVAGNTSLTANNGGAVNYYPITLANSGNVFTGTVGLIGSNVSLLDSGSSGLTLGNTSATGNLTAVSRGGSITQQSGTAIDVTGTTSLTANSGSAGYGITLANAANDLVGTVSSNGSSIDLVDSSTGGLKLGNIIATGSLTLSSLGGNITQAGGTSIGSSGATNVTANNGGSTGYGITLGNSTNDFTGAITAKGNAITVTDAAALNAVIDSTGATTLTSAGALNVSGTVGTSLTTKTTGAGAATTFGATSVGTKLVVTSTGTVSEISPNVLTVDGLETTTYANPNVTVNGVKGAKIP